MTMKISAMDISRAKMKQKTSKDIFRVTRDTRHDTTYVAISDKQT